MKCPLHSPDRRYIWPIFVRAVLPYDPARCASIAQLCQPPPGNAQTRNRQLSSTTQYKNATTFSKSHDDVSSYIGGRAANNQHMLHQLLLVLVCRPTNDAMLRACLHFSIVRRGCLPCVAPLHLQCISRPGPRSSSNPGGICEDSDKDCDQIPQSDPGHVPSSPAGHTTDAVRTFALWILAHYTERTDDREHVASHGGLRVRGDWFMHTPGNIPRHLTLAGKRHAHTRSWAWPGLFHLLPLGMTVHNLTSALGSWYTKVRTPQYG